MPEPLQLPLHVGDVFERPGLGVRAVLDRGVLGGQAERVPAERMQDVEAAHALHAGDDVTDHVVADVSDVGVARRVGEHLEAVELRLLGILGDLEGAVVAPLRPATSFRLSGVCSRARSNNYIWQAAFSLSPFTFVPVPSARSRARRVSERLGRPRARARRAPYWIETDPTRQERNR